MQETQQVSIQNQRQETHSGHCTLESWRIQELPRPSCRIGGIRDSVTVQGQRPENSLESPWYLSALESLRNQRSGEICPKPMAAKDILLFKTATSALQNRDTSFFIPFLVQLGYVPLGWCHQLPVWVFPPQFAGLHISHSTHTTTVLSLPTRYFILHSNSHLVIKGHTKYDPLDNRKSII